MAACLKSWISPLMKTSDWKDKEHSLNQHGLFFPIGQNTCFGFGWDEMRCLNLFKHNTWMGWRCLNCASSLKSLSTPSKARGQRPTQAALLKDIYSLESTKMFLKRGEFLHNAMSSPVISCPVSPITSFAPFWIFASPPKTKYFVLGAGEAVAI